ncbi:hypothetical protein [Streptomyces chartreusis]|uniref:hypothetical protein n=1 Tax=Streptomyces chartreusis TaxID=1969 RepID=UPI0033CB731A
MTEKVIAAARRDPAAGALPYLLPHVNVPWVEGGVANPMDEALLADAAFPSGRPLSPSLRAWLAYDISLLERHKWFTPDGDFAPRPLDQLVGDEMGDFWGVQYPFEFAPVYKQLGPEPGQDGTPNGTATDRS